MAEKDPIDLLREQLNKVEGLSGLHPDHETFKQWHGDTQTILEKAFSFKSIHYQSFVALRFREIVGKAFASPEIDKINANRFKKDLENSKNVLQGSIKELTLDRTLFKKIQTTPKTVEVSLKGECFISLGAQDPELIQTLKTSLERDGLNLVWGAGSLRDRVEQIRRARLGIFDLSVPEKAEALLEIGIALGLGKEVILLHKKSSSIPEIVKELSRIEYEGFSDLTEKLRKKIG
ncbi:MAG: hypothetical protein A2W09_08460 [Deltaproteobacteria bacterium RBG_16_50_11]|nr:MAG: hypothetical protein A2W09_08460 [Deltaproteobacteria bacterium RBG_16_50_11]